MIPAARGRRPPPQPSQHTIQVDLDALLCGGSTADECKGTYRVGVAAGKSYNLSLGSLAVTTCRVPLL